MKTFQLNCPRTLVSSMMIALISFTTPAHAAITVTGGSWVQASGDYNSIEVQDATVRIDDGSVAWGWSVEIDNSDVTVIGEGSQFGSHSTFSISGTDMSIEDGGSVYAGGEGSYITSNSTVRISGSGSVLDSGELRIGESSSLIIENGGMITDVYGYGYGDVSGTATVTGVGSLYSSRGLSVGGVNTSAVLNIEDHGRIEVDHLYGHGSLKVAEASNAEGTINLISGTIAFKDSLPLTPDRFTTGDGTANLNFTGGTLEMNGRSLIAGVGTTNFNFTGGAIKGAATIDLGQPMVQGGGMLAPGSSIGQTDIVGEYDLNAGGIEIELGGAGDPIDLVTATGDIDIALLGTTLDLRAIGSMAAGTYTLLESTGGTITGIFENISTLNLFGVNVTVANTGTAVTVTLDSDLLFADPSMDGFVGIEDLNIVLANWNQSVTPGDGLAGDLNGDGFIGIEDLNNVLANWNQGTPPPSEVLSTVPEPACAVVMMLGILGAVRRRRCA